MYYTGWRATMLSFELLEASGSYSHLFYNLWTSLSSNLDFRTNYDARDAESHAFGVIDTGVKSGFYGQTLTPATDNHWVKSQ